MHDDAVLLRRYVEEDSEAAFAELVRRHVDLVYGAAMRRTGGDPHLSADVAQRVFVALARNAADLSRDTVLGAWLHTATRNAALKLMISEQRRRVRETQALALGAVTPETEVAPDWDRLRPLIDAAIDELPEADRASVILRFFERRAFAEIGAALRVSEDAARMRTERALDKLRVALGRRGIKSTVTALAAAVASQPAISAPAGLAATLATQSLAAASAGALAPALASFMTAKIVTAAALSAVVAFFIGSTIGPGRNNDPLPSPPAKTPSSMPELATLRNDNQRLQAEITRLRGDLTALKETNTALAAQRAAPPSSPVAQPAALRKSPTLGLARHEVQQAVLNNLRQIAAARDQYRLENGQSAGSVHALVGRQGFIKAIRTVGGEDYAELSMNGGGPLTVTTPDGIGVTFDPTGVLTTKPEVPPELARVQELGQKMQPAIRQAVAAFRAANNGANPGSEQALLPYFATPQEGADFVELLEARKAAGP